MAFHSSHDMTGDDKRLMVFAYLVPGAGSLVGAAAYKAYPDGLQYFKTCEKPTWAPKNSKVYLGLDMAAIAPVGCAAMLAYKHGGGCENKFVAYGLVGYTASMALSALVVPAFLKKEIKAASAICGAATATGLLTAALFAKVDKYPALMMLPWTALHGFYTLLLVNTKAPTA